MPKPARQPSRFTIRVAGEENIGGKDLLRLETKADDQLIQVQFISVDDRGVLMHGRRATAGEVTTFKPPRVLLPIPLQVGTKWELDDDVAGTTMHQVFKVGAEETVIVPAGEFRAYKLHCEQPWPLSISIDRWFAPGTGFVQEVTTTRGTGRTLAEPRDDRADEIPSRTAHTGAAAFGHDLARQFDAGSKAQP